MNLICRRVLVIIHHSALFCCSCYALDGNNCVIYDVTFSVSAGMSLRKRKMQNKSEYDQLNPAYYLTHVKINLITRTRYRTVTLEGSSVLSGHGRENLFLYTERYVFWWRS
jgi:hypothetical protein